MIRVIVLILTLLLVVVAAAQVGTEDLEYDLYSGVLVDDPERAGERPVPLQVSGGVAVIWMDGDEDVLTNVKLRRRDRLEAGGRLDIDPASGDISGAVLGMRHQIHRYLAWGISDKVNDRANDNDTGGSFVLMARKRRWLGTLLGMKAQLGAGLGDAVALRGNGVGLRAVM